MGINLRHAVPAAVALVGGVPAFFVSQLVVGEGPYIVPPLSLSCAVWAPRRLRPAHALEGLGVLTSTVPFPAWLPDECARPRRSRPRGRSRPRSRPP